MTYSQGTPNRLSIGDVLSQTWFCFRKNFVLIAGLSGLLIGVETYLFYEDTLQLYSSPSFADFPWALIAVALALEAVLVGLIEAFTAGAVYETLHGRRATTADSIRAAIPWLFVVVAVSVLVLAATLAGILLLVVPGIILSLMWYPIIPVIVLEGRPIGEAFSRAAYLTSGYKWPIFGLTLILGAAAWGLDQILQLTFLAAADFSTYSIVTSLTEALLVGLQATMATVLLVQLQKLHDGPGIEDVGRVFD